MVRRFRFRLLTMLVATAAAAGGLTVWVKRPMLALEGYCPVSLSRDLGWKPGDPDLTATYRGQLFYFANPQSRQVFEGDPKVYAPAMEGADVVLLYDEGRRVAGERQYGFRYFGRVLLFAEANTMNRFVAAPAKYLALVQQAESRR